MANDNILPIIAIVMMVFGCTCTIVAMATTFWGKMDPTETGNYYNVINTCTSPIKKRFFMRFSNKHKCGISLAS